jgi:WD40 repeat protein
MLKILMDRAGRSCTIPVFADAFFKAHNSISMHKNKVNIERLLEKAFTKYDRDRDGVLQFKDLPLQDVLLGRDPLREKKDVTVYSDFLVALRWSADAAEAKFGSVPDFAECSSVAVHASLNKYSVSWRNHLLLFDVDVDNGLLLPFTRLSAHSSTIVKALYVPQLMSMFTSGADNVLWRWSEMDGWVGKERSRIPSVQVSLAFVPSTQVLLSGGCDGAVYLYHTDPKLSQPFRRILAHGDCWVMDIALLAELDEFATCSSDGTLKMWSLSTLELKRANAVPMGAHLVAMSYSGKQRALYTVGAGRVVYVWSPFLPKPTEVLRAHDRAIVGIQSFNRSPEVITVDLDGKICIWDMRSTTVVQTIGGADSACPAHSVQSMAYDLEGRSVVILGERMSLVVPQQGANSALMEAPVQCIAYNPLEKHVYASSAGRIIAVDLPTGSVVAVRSFGGVEITHMVLSPPHMVLGTLEGQIISVLLGSWKRLVAITLPGEIKALCDLGTGPNSMHSMVTHSSMAAAVSSNGDVVFFVYDSQDAAPRQSQERFATNTDDVRFATLSGRHKMLYLGCQQGVLHVWDLVVRCRKASHKFPTPIACMTASDEASAVFVATTDGAVRGIHQGSGVTIFHLVPESEFVPQILSFNAATWSLCAVAVSGIMAISLERVLRAVNDQREETGAHQNLLDLSTVGEYQFDRSVRSSLLRAFYCRLIDEADSSPVLCGVASSVADERQAVQQLQHLRRLQQSTVPAGSAEKHCCYILWPLDVVVPSTRERISAMDTAYSIVPRFALEQDPLRALYDAAVNPRALEEKVVASVRWMLSCVIQALAHIHAAGAVGLLDPNAIRLVGSTYVVVFPRGVWSVGADVAAADLPPHRTPPEGLARATPAVDMWQLGLILYSCMCGRPLLAEGTAPRRDIAATGIIDVQRDIAPPLRQALLLSLLRRLLAADPLERLTAAEAMRMVGGAALSPPAHISHIQLEQVAGETVAPTLPLEDFVEQTLPTALRSSHPSALLLANNPTLWIVGEFDGQSAHLVLWSHRSGGKLLGITPPNNGVNVLYSAAQEEVTSTVNAEGVLDDLDDAEVTVLLAPGSPASLGSGETRSVAAGSGRALPAQVMRRAPIFGRSIDASSNATLQPDYRPRSRARSVMTQSRISTADGAFREPRSLDMAVSALSDHNLRVKLPRLRPARAFH